MSEINWKNKYAALKAKYKGDVDVAFRVGFEQGAQAATQQAQQDQMMQQQAAQQAAMQGGQPGQPGQPGQGGAPQDPGQPEPAGGLEPQQQGQESPQDPQGGSELDQHISKLESMINKSELSPEDLMKALVELKELRKAEATRPKKLAPKAFTFNSHANHNLPQHAKEALTSQHRIVDDIMKSWADEEERAKSDIRSLLANEGLFKHED